MYKPKYHLAIYNLKSGGTPFLTYNFTELKYVFETIDEFKLDLDMKYSIRTIPDDD